MIKLIIFGVDRIHLLLLMNVNIGYQLPKQYYVNTLIMNSYIRLFMLIDKLIKDIPILKLHLHMEEKSI